MALNKSAKTEIGTVIVWVLIVGVIAYVANFGGFQTTVNGMLGNNAATNNAATNTNTAQNSPLTDTSNCPTSGQTTFTINVQDALATTTSPLYPEYYIFNGDGLISTGTLSSTASTVTVACGKDYTFVLLNTTAGTGYYDVELPEQARIAYQTVNTQLTQEGTGKIIGVINPGDSGRGIRVANVTLANSPNGQHNFDLQFQENASQKGFNQPIIACQANQSSIANIALLSFDNGDGTTSTPGTAPAAVKRLQALGGNLYYYFAYPKMLTSASPIVTAHLQLTATASPPAGTSTQGNVSCILLDQAQWRHALYKTATSWQTAFAFGPENTESIGTDVGAVDSSAGYLYFDTAGY